MKILCIIYVAGYVATFPKRFRFVLNETSYSWGIETEDVVFAVIISVLTGVFWPAIMLGDFLNNAVIQPWVKSLNDRKSK